MDRISLRRIDRRGEELPDSPLVKEGSEATLVSSPSPSDHVIRMTEEVRSGYVGGGATTVGPGEDLLDYERRKQWTPNMQEILAKLRTFESGSPVIDREG